MREQFTDNEWSQLKLLPIYVYTLIAGADGKIDEKEERALNNTLKRAEKIVDPLHRELLVEIAEGGPDTLKSLIAEALKNPNMVDPKDQSITIGQARNIGYAETLIAKNPHIEKIIRPMMNILVEHLSQDEQRHFLASIYVFGKRIARSSGGFLGFWSISMEEDAVLFPLIRVFGIDTHSVDVAMYELDRSYKF